MRTSEDGETRTVGRNGQASNVSAILIQSSRVSWFTSRSSSTTPCLISRGTKLPAPGAMDLREISTRPDGKSQPASDWEEKRAAENRDRSRGG